jgi:tetratricopeptide (TPR) repeat protein
MIGIVGPEEDLSTLIDRHDHLNILRYIRAHKLRESELVVTHGSKLFGITVDDDIMNSDSAVGIISISSSGAKSLGHAEILAALEQLCIASLDVGNIRLAEACLTAIRGGGDTSSSPPFVSQSSTRYRKLLGLYLEATGDYDGASSLYTQLLSENPSNSHAAKRQYCILAAQPNKEVEAVACLNEYLVSHPGDVAAWYQMYLVRLSVCDFVGAAFCLEEVILACPLDSNVHTLCGEAYATAGGLSHSKLARKHLAMAIQLNPNNLRAWYGLLSASEGYLEEVHRLTTTTASGGSGGGGKNGKRVAEEEEESMEVAKEMIKLLGEKLMQVYTDKKMMGIVEIIVRDSSELL